MKQLSSGLIGYQEVIEWMGVETLTLAEVWPEDARTVIVGVNPSLTSVAAGHYFQGRGARSQIGKLVRAGLFEGANDGLHFEQSALEAGVGFADLVRKPTPRANQVSASELAYGRKLFEANLASRNVQLVIGIYAPPINALMGRRTKPGFQDERTSWGARVFRMPGPMQERESAAKVMDSLTLG